MTTRPITLTPDQLRAALAGRLEQLRLPVEPQPRLGVYGNGSIIGDCPGQIGDDGYHVWDSPEDGVIPVTHGAFYRMARSAPLGTIGDRLWVREAWSLGLIGIEIGFPYAMIEYKVDGCERFTYISQNIYDKFKDSPDQDHWRESDTMPQWASRITLEIIGVRVERDETGVWVWVYSVRKVGE